jgi:hypothetical protein
MVARYVGKYGGMIEESWSVISLSTAYLSAKPKAWVGVLE